LLYRNQIAMGLSKWTTLTCPAMKASEICAQDRKSTVVLP
jgi:hypothetical protein